MKIRAFQNPLIGICTTIRTTCGQNFSRIWRCLLVLLDLLWELGLMIFDVPKDVGFPETLVISNIFGFPAVNWAPNWSNTVNLHAFHLSQNSNFWRTFQTLCLPYWETFSGQNLPQIVIYPNEIFHLTKSWEVKMSLKISFLANFDHFLILQ